MLKEKGYTVGNVDAVIVAEHVPHRLGKGHINNIRKKLADVMKIDIDAVSVKASTSEQLGLPDAKREWLPGR